MVEGGGRFTASASTELRSNQIEGITYEVLEDRELVEYLVTKIQQKIRFKQAVSHDDGTNDFAEWKRLGMFIVNWKKIPDALVSILQRNGIDILADEILELHIPPHNATFSDIKESMTRLKEYLNANKSNKKLPKYIVGISYLAAYATRWGFSVIDLPDQIKGESGAAEILKKYAESIEDPKKNRLAEKFKVRDIQLCYISVENFLANGDQNH